MCWRYLLIVPLSMMVVGCIQLGLTSGIFPTIDHSIRSVDYYNSHHKIDLLSTDHDMNEEVNISREGTSRVNPIFRNVKFNNQSLSMKPNTEHLTNSKKVGKNDYIVKLNNISPIKPQEGDLLCWAACVQYLVFRAYNKVIDQNTIVNEVKNRKMNSDASVLEMMKALGLIGARVTPSGANHVIETLGRNEPVMIGLKNKDGGMIGHAIIVVGARYSFANPYVPSMPPNANLTLIPGFLKVQTRAANKFAFNEFYVLDPHPEEAGVMIIEKASTIEDRVAFVLSFNVV